MARDNYDVREEYLGAGNKLDYTFDFKIEDLSQLLIIEKDTNGDVTQRVDGNDGTYIDNVVFDATEGAGTVNLLANLTTGYSLYILLANDAPTQPYQFRNKGSFTLKTIEMALDFLSGAVQRLAFLAGRSVKLDDSVDTGVFDPALPIDILDFPEGLIGVNAAGDALEMYANLSTSAGDFTETIDSEDYSDAPESGTLSEYDPATNKIVFDGGGITDLLSIVGGTAGERLMLVNAQGTTINVTNEDAGETAGTRISTGTGNTIGFADGTIIFLNYDGESSTWRVVGGTASNTGDVIGPATAVDNTVSRYDGTTGKLVQGSSAHLDDAGDLRLGGTLAPNVSAILDLSNTTKGLLPPAMSTTQRNAIATPATGLVIYNLTEGVLNQYDGSAWVEVGSGGAGSALVAEFDSTSLVASDPGAGKFKLDSATPASVTEIYVNATTDNGADIGSFVNRLVAGDLIYIQESGTPANFLTAEVTGFSDFGGVWYTIAISIFDSSTLFGNTEDCAVSFGYCSNSHEVLTGIGTRTHAEIDALIDNTQSAGYISGAAFTNNNDGTVSVASGVGLIRATDSDTAAIAAITWSASTPSDVVLTDSTLSYVYVEYNAGTPKVIATVTERTDCNTNILLGTIYREALDLHFTEAARDKVVNFPKHVLKRLRETESFKRASGSILSETGTRNVAWTVGSWWVDLSSLSTQMGDTSGAAPSNNSFAYYYYNGSTWVIDSLNIDTPVFTGAGLDDMSSSGTLATSHSLQIEVEIDTTGTPDTFKWKYLDNDGVTEVSTTGVAITGSAQLLTAGISITFAATTGHTLGDVWTVDAYLSKAINNTQYNDIAGGLTALSNNKYGVHWVYMDIHGHVSILYGQGDYSLTDAQETRAPASVPGEFEKHATLIGRIIIKKNDAAFTAIENNYAKQFASSVATDHLDLLSIGTNTHAQIDTQMGITGVSAIATLASDDEVLAYDLTGTVVGKTTVQEIADFGGSADPVQFIDGQDRSFDVDIGSWAAYADAAATTPVDMTGGSPTLTITQTGTTPLTGDGMGVITKDGSSRLGEGVSLSGIAIPDGYQGQPLKFRVIGEGSANYASGDLIVNTYDQTNSLLLGAVQNVDSGEMPKGKTIIEGIVYPASDTATIRLGFHVATTNTSTWTFNIDEVQLFWEPEVQVPGNYDLGNESWTDSEDDLTTIELTQLGSWLKGAAITEIDSAYSGGSLTITIPAKYAPSSEYIFTNDKSYTVGSLSFVDNGGTYWKGHAQLISATSIRLHVWLVSGSWVKVTNPAANTPFTWVFGDSIVWDIMYKVEGWTANTISALSINSGLQKFQASRSAAQTVATATNTVIQFDTIDTDTRSLWDSTNYRFVADRDMWVLVDASVAFAANASNSRRMFLRKNGSTILEAGYVPSSGYAGVSANASKLVHLTVDDYIDVNLYQDSGSGLDIASVNRTFLNIAEIPFSQTALLSLGSTAVETKTAAHTLTASDDIVIGDVSSGAFTFTLPTAVGIKGTEYTIQKESGATDFNALTVDGDGTETVGDSTSIKLFGAGESVDFVSDGVNWIITDWTESEVMTYTPTIASSTNKVINTARVTFGRRGLDIHGQVTFNGSGGGAVRFAVTIPVGPVIDTAKIPGGTGTGNDTQSILTNESLWFDNGTAWTAINGSYASTTTIGFNVAPGQFQLSQIASGDAVNYRIHVPVT